MGIDVGFFMPVSRDITTQPREHDILVLIVGIEKARDCNNVIIENVITNITTATPNPKH